MSSSFSGIQDALESLGDTKDSESDVMRAVEMGRKLLLRIETLQREHEKSAAEGARQSEALAHQAGDLEREKKGMQLILQSQQQELNVLKAERILLQERLNSVEHRLEEENLAKKLVEAQSVGPLRKRLVELEVEVELERQASRDAQELLKHLTCPTRTEGDKRFPKGEDTKWMFNEDGTWPATIQMSCEEKTQKKSTPTPTPLLQDASWGQHAQHWRRGLTIKNLPHTSYEDVDIYLSTPTSKHYESIPESPMGTESVPRHLLALSSRRPSGVGSAPNSSRRSYPHSPHHVHSFADETRLLKLQVARTDQALDKYSCSCRQSTTSSLYSPLHPSLRHFPFSPTSASTAFPMSPTSVPGASAEDVATHKKYQREDQDDIHDNTTQLISSSNGNFGHEGPKDEDASKYCQAYVCSDTAEYTSLWTELAESGTLMTANMKQRPSLSILGSMLEPGLSIKGNSAVEKDSPVYGWAVIAGTWFLCRWLCVIGYIHLKVFHGLLWMMSCMGSIGIALSKMPLLLIHQAWKIVDFMTSAIHSIIHSITPLLTFLAICFYTGVLRSLVALWSGTWDCMYVSSLLSVSAVLVSVITTQWMVFIALNLVHRILLGLLWCGRHIIQGGLRVGVGLLWCGRHAIQGGLRVYRILSCCKRD